MRRPKNTTRANHSKILNLDMLFDQSAGGIQVSGDSGTGKSSVMALMMQQLAENPRGPGFALIDPHGDLASDMQAFCASLPPRQQRRVVIVHPADTSRIAPVNPLGVDPENLDDLTWRARVLKKAGHCAKILLHAWGERDFNSKPLLFKFCCWYLETLGLARLLLPEVRCFFDPQHPIYTPLSLLAPDTIAQNEILELADMRFSEREDLIASTKNRFLGFLKNPIVELSLGKLGAVLDARTLIQEGAIFLINLEPGGVLRDEDREILANIWLSEFLFAAYNTPRDQRRSFALFVDELPILAASANLIRESATQVRKFRLHFCCAHAGTQFFPDGKDDKLLNGLTGACRVHVLFRHQHEVDATYFAKLVKLPEFNARKVKHVQKQPIQFQDGHEVMVLTDTAENWTKANQKGNAEATGATDTRTETAGTRTDHGTTRTETEDERSLRRSVAEAQAATTGQSASTAHAQGSTRTSTASWSRTNSRGGARTYKQTLVPRLVVREIVTSLQFFTPEEQYAEAASELSSYPIGTGLLYIAGQGAVRVQFPLPKRPFRMAPRFAAKKLRQLQALVFSRPEYASAATVQLQRRHFLQTLACHLSTLVAKRQREMRALPPRLEMLPQDPTHDTDPPSPLAI